MQVNLNAQVLSNLVTHNEKRNGNLILEFGHSVVTYWAQHDNYLIRVDEECTEDINGTKAALKLNTTATAKAVFKTLKKHKRAVFTLEELDSYGYYTTATLKTVDNLDVAVFKLNEDRYIHTEKLRDVYSRLIAEETEKTTKSMIIEPGNIPEFISRDVKTLYEIRLKTSTLILTTAVDNTEITCILAGRKGI